MNIEELLGDADFVGKLAALAALASSLPVKSEPLPLPTKSVADLDFSTSMIAGGIVSDDCA